VRRPVSISKKKKGKKEKKEKGGETGAKPVRIRRVISRERKRKKKTGYGEREITGRLSLIRPLSRGGRKKKKKGKEERGRGHIIRHFVQAFSSF